MSRIAELEQLLRKASEAYYGGGEDSTLLDQEFDRKRDELEELDPTNPFLAAVGAPADSALTKVKHAMPMGSLHKMNKPAQFKTWLASVSKAITNPKLAISEKLDGVSIEILFKDGHFVQAVTRGDGEVGEDVTHTIKNAQGFPHRITDEGEVSVRCECLLKIDAWKEHFSDKANPRNAASGLVRRSSAEGSKHLVCIAFDVLSENNNFKTEMDRVAWLKDSGFKTVSTELATPMAAGRVIDAIEKKRGTLDVEIDGVVIKLNDIAAQNKLGEHNGRPYFARAWKFSPMGAFTVLEAVEWNVGTQGTINPVAKVKPVKVAGVVIQNISLHNIEEIERLGIKIGDEVEIVRAGDVIPHLVRVVSFGVSRSDINIDECPSCGSDIRRRGPKLFCVNADRCPGVASKVIKKWIKKRNIMFLGDSATDTLIEANVVRSIPDLYALTLDTMTTAGVGKGMSAKILVEIDKSRSCPLHELIGSLSLDMLGRSEAKNLIKHGVSTLARWKTLTKAEIEWFPGYQETKATRISAAIRDNWELIEKTAACLTVEEKQKMSSGKLNEASFCFTGSMSMKRSDLEQKARNAGGEIKNVSRNLKYLVIADPDSTSTKAKKARELGISLISEDEFLQMV